jgi:hypothetical protein
MKVYRPRRSSFRAGGLRDGARGDRSLLLRAVCVQRGRPVCVFASICARSNVSQVVIENPILNSPYEEPRRHFRFTEDGITDEIVEAPG